MRYLGPPGSRLIDVLKVLDSIVLREWHNFEISARQNNGLQIQNELILYYSSMAKHRRWF
jgi:hypothetical protein